VNAFRCVSILEIPSPYLHTNHFSNQAGGVYVDRAIRHLLEEKLATSPTFGTKEMINIMMEEFEKKVCLEIRRKVSYFVL
jgi:hypothetical protein